MMRWSWVVCLLIATNAARAGTGVWYFKWSCSGQCAPGQLAITGVAGPFLSYEECDEARWTHENHARVRQSGNFGGQGYCQQTDDPDPDQMSAPTRPLALAKFGTGVVMGGPWTATEPGGITTTGPTRTYGLDIEVDFGSPRLALEGTLGLWLAQVDSPHFGDGNKRTMLVPFVIGFQSTPFALWRSASLEVRPDLGAGLAFLWTGTCSYCVDTGSTHIGWRLKAGLNFYVGRGNRIAGLALDFLVTHVGAGDIMDDILPSAVEMRAPMYMLRFGVTARNPNLLGW